jgi:alpha-beta hydrolase superfamily lysophospholipase
VGLAIIGAIKRIKGDKHFSKLIDGIAFGSYNSRFGGDDSADPSKWLTCDESVRRIYYADKYCTFKFTVSAMGDLITLIKRSNRADWFKNVSDDMPILLVSGEDDPVGNYGKGVHDVEAGLVKQGKRVECKLYKGARHEILNDFTYRETFDDIVKFCEN